MLEWFDNSFGSESSSPLAWVKLFIHKNNVVIKSSFIATCDKKYANVSIGFVFKYLFNAVNCKKSV
jgi:hypothetical protein